MNDFRELILQAPPRRINQGKNAKKVIARHAIMVVILIDLKTEILSHVL
jgi:hypothetical protein